MAATTQLPASARPGARPVPRGRASFSGALPLRIHQDPLGPLHILDAARAGARHDRHRRARQRRDGLPLRPDRPGRLRPDQLSLGGLYVGQLIIAVLGALTITSEYSTGMIRTSLSVQSRRGTLFAAKAVVFGAVALVTGLVASFAAFFVGQAFLSGKHLNATLSSRTSCAR